MHIASLYLGPLAPTVYSNVDLPHNLAANRKVVAGGHALARQACPKGLGWRHGEQTRELGHGRVGRRDKEQVVCEWCQL